MHTQTRTANLPLFWKYTYGACQICSDGELCLISRVSVAVYHMKMLLGDCNAKVGRENICKPTIRQESLHQDSNDIKI